MEILSGHDIVIVGGGAAGLRAAIAAAELDPNADIAIVSKVYPTRSHTVSAEGGLAAALKDYDSLEQHSYDTVKGSDYLADQDVVEFFVQKAKEEVYKMEHWGCPWSREADGTIAVRAFGGMSVKRTVYAADKTGFYMLHSLFEQTLKFPNIKRYDEWYVTKLLKDEERVTGVCAINLKTGKLAAIPAHAVIIATGGAGKLYKFTTNSAIKTGDGIAIALNAGAALKDMEFMQFHPTALLKTGILITEGARGEGGYLINKNGERFLKNYIPEKMELGPRDIITRAILTEIREGRGLGNKHGKYVELDIRHLGEKTINEKLPLVREVAREYGNVDPVYEPIPIAPAQHYTMGGIHTDIHGQTSLPGLFAAGEAACVTINGANRLGSNSLSECLVFGAEAGESAVKSIHSSQKRRVPFETSAKNGKDEEALLDHLLQQQGKEKTATIREEMEQNMDNNAGPLRDETSLKKGLEKILELQERSSHISLSDHGHVFNTELINLIELKGMLKLSEAVIHSAINRKESRGAHSRTDYTKRDDENFLHHQLVTLKNTTLHFTKQPVTITKWQPAERKY